MSTSDTVVAPRAVGPGMPGFPSGFMLFSLHSSVMIAEFFQQLSVRLTRDRKGALGFSCCAIRMGRFWGDGSRHMWSR